MSETNGHLNGDATDALARGGGEDTVRVERLEGEIDLAVVPELTRLLTAIPNALHTLIVDLTAVTFLDSSGVRLLHELHDRLRVRSQRLVVLSPLGTPPRRVLELTAFGQRVPLTDSLPAALEAAAGEARDGR